jgi:hypothetical protein
MIKIERVKNKVIDYKEIMEKMKNKKKIKKGEGK